jgi:uncharacterized membrane protein
MKRLFQFWLMRLFRYFVNGLLVSAPVALTIYVCWVLFTTIDGWLRIPIPGLGFLITVVLITLLGFLASNFVAQRLLGLVEDLVNRVPGVRLLYTSIRDVLAAFAGHKKKVGQPVLVTLDPNIGTKAIGFMTQESLQELGLADHATVYLPQSYNFAGQMLVVPHDRLVRLEAPTGKVMTFIVSGGMAPVEEDGKGTRR